MPPPAADGTAHASGRSTALRPHPKTARRSYDQPLGHPVGTHLSSAVPLFKRWGRRCGGTQRCDRTPATKSRHCQIMCALVAGAAPSLSSTAQKCIKALASTSPATGDVDARALMHFCAVEDKLGAAPATSAHMIWQCLDLVAGVLSHRCVPPQRRPHRLNKGTADERCVPTGCPSGWS